MLIANGVSRGERDFAGETALDLSQHAPTIEVLKTEKTRIPSLEALALRQARKSKLSSTLLPIHLLAELSTHFK